jgi:hypothetical protein
MRDSLAVVRGEHNARSLWPMPLKMDWMSPVMVWSVIQRLSML